MNKKSPIKREFIRRIAGQSLSDKLFDEVLGHMVLHIVFPLAVAFGVLQTILTKPITPWLPWIILAVYLCWGLWGIVWLRRRLPQIDNLRVGRDGELAVGQTLDSCNAPGWKVLHDFQTSEIGNIDHIVVAPQGVFCIETKTLRKNEPDEQIVYDGISITTSSGRSLSDNGRDPLKQALGQAKFLKEHLYSLTGRYYADDPKSIVTFPGWYVKLAFKVNYPRVLVMNTDFIVSNIPTWPRKLSNEDVTVIYEALVRSQREYCRRQE